MNPNPNTDNSQPADLMAHPVIVNGVRLLKEGVARDFSAIRGLDCFANLKSFDLAGLPAVSAAIDALPLAEETAIAAVDGAGDFSAFKAIRNAATKQPWGVQKSGYVVVQPRDAFFGFLDAIQAAGLHVLADIKTTHDGARIHGRLLVLNPEATITCLEDTGDRLMLGFRFSTTHDGSGAFRVSPFAVRVVCLNDNTWGEWLPAITVRHDRSAVQKAADLTAYMTGLLDTVPTIRRMVQEAAAVQVAPRDFALAALGAGLAPRQVANWTAQFDAFEPAPAAGHNLWTAYNSLTAYLTHAPKAAGLGPESRDAALDLAAGLLDPSAVASLAAKGAAMVADLQKARDAKVAAQGKGAKVRLTVPAIPLVGLK